MVKSSNRINAYKYYKPNETGMEWKVSSTADASNDATCIILVKSSLDRLGRGSTGLLFLKVDSGIVESGTNVLWWGFPRANSGNIVVESGQQSSILGNTSSGCVYWKIISSINLTYSIQKLNNLNTSKMDFKNFRYVCNNESPLRKRNIFPSPRTSLNYC